VRPLGDSDCGAMPCGPWVVGSGPTMTLWGRGVANPLIIVMPGLDPGIHAAGVAAGGEASGMDPVVKPRGDGCGVGGCD